MISAGAGAERSGRSRWHSHRARLPQRWRRTPRGAATDHLVNGLRTSKRIDSETTLFQTQPRGSRKDRPSAARNALDSGRRIRAAGKKRENRTGRRLSLQPPGIEKLTCGRGRERTRTAEAPYSRTSALRVPAPPNPPLAIMRLSRSAQRPPRIAAGRTGPRPRRPEPESNLLESVCETTASRTRHAPPRRTTGPMTLLRAHSDCRSSRGRGSGSSTWPSASQGARVRARGDHLEPAGDPRSSDVRSDAPRPRGSS